MSGTTKVLYISYDGMTDPLGQSQVLPYLKLLSQSGYSIHLISYEKKNLFEEKQNTVKDFIQNRDIEWIPISYTKKPAILSTLYDLIKGWLQIKKLYKKNQYEIVHCRGYISAILGRACKKKYSTKFIFDMRGWWVDEKLESGNWNGIIFKFIYHYFKSLEKKFFAESDYIISLTEAGKHEIVKNDFAEEDKIAVIPTCVDFDIFKQFDHNIRNGIRGQLDISNETFVIVYSGSLGGNYRNDVIFNLFKCALTLNQNSILLLLTSTPPDSIEAELSACQINFQHVKILNIDFKNVYKYLISSDLGLIFYDKSYSSIGRSPTKLGEYWACGVPFISSKGIGDLELLKDKYHEGSVLIDNFQTSDYLNALQLISSFNGTKEKLREYAIDYFDIHKGVQQYLSIYKQLS